MKISRYPWQFIAQLGEPIHPKTRQERRDSIISALIILGGLAVLYYYYFA